MNSQEFEARMIEVE